MKTASAILFLFFAGVIGPAPEQEPPSTNATVSLHIGLETGQQAPPFALLDQFGRKQSSETLKGANGTVLLFFRSADW
jgi:cytochrome oxidase Cu insertion factor (SCO1/SenC/PrrC family)